MLKWIKARFTNASKSDVMSDVIRDLGKHKRQAKHLEAMSKLEDTAAIVYFSNSIDRRDLNQAICDLAFEKHPKVLIHMPIEFYNHDLIAEGLKKQPTIYHDLPETQRNERLSSVAVEQIPDLITEAPKGLSNYSKLCFFAVSKSPDLLDWLDQTNTQLSDADYFSLCQVAIKKDEEQLRHIQISFHEKKGIEVLSQWSSLLRILLKDSLNTFECNHLSIRIIKPILRKMDQKKIDFNDLNLRDALMTFVEHCEQLRFSTRDEYCFEQLKDALSTAYYEADVQRFKQDQAAMECNKSSRHSRQSAIDGMAL